MKNKTKKIVSLLSALVLLCTSMAGCGEKETATDGKVEITIGNVPEETNEAEYEVFKSRVAEMNEKYPNVNVVERRYGYSLETFLPLASSGDLPMLYDTFFTETKKIIDGNYAGDITKQITERGFDKAISPSVMIDLTRDGKYFGIPCNVYVMGLLCNAQLFEQAGLVDENGIPLFPTTWEDLAEKAKIIQEKTGVQGFFMPTMDGNGGWHFMNIAWAFGAKFEECIDGKWTAVYNSPEMVNAFQYVHDLKWKYDVIGDNALVNVPTFRKQFAGGQVAMGIYAPSNERNNFAEIFKQNPLPLEAFSMCALPKGVDGTRKALMGGTLYMFSQTATQEELDACFNWLEICGFTPKMGEEKIAKLKEDFAADNQNNYVVGSTNAYVWSDKNYLNTIEEARKDYINVDQRKFEQYPDLENTTLMPEEPYCAQDLYRVIDALLQKVLLEENVDIQAMLDESVKEFQFNFLDKIN